MRLTARCDLKSLSAILPHFHGAELNYETTVALPHRVSKGSIEILKPTDVRLIADSIGFFDYRIFPERIMQFYGDWQFEERSMMIGDNIVQCARLPLGWIRGVFAVRIQGIQQSAEVCSFSYGTLVGHAEMGLSTLTIRQEENAIVFEIETFSKPAWLMARLTKTLAGAYQQRCTNLAIENVISRIRHYTESTHS